MTPSSSIKCPHCEFVFNEEEADTAIASGCDCGYSTARELAANEAKASIFCPVCEAQFALKGDFVSKFTTAFSTEQLDDDE